MQDDGYLVSVANVTADEMITREVGMVHEVLTQYGPVHRFWFDGTSDLPDKVCLKHFSHIQSMFSVKFSLN